MERVPPASNRLLQVDVGFLVYLICILFLGCFWFPSFPPGRVSARDGVGPDSHLPPGSAERRGLSLPHESAFIPRQCASASLSPQGLEEIKHQFRGPGESWVGMQGEGEGERV